MPELAGLLSTVIAVAAVVIALAAYRFERRRAHFEIARTLHQDLTTGEVARSRKILGELHYGTFEGPSTELDLPSALTAYFTVLWSFERIEAGKKRNARRVDPTPPAPGPRSALLRLAALMARGRVRLRPLRRSP